MHSGNSWLLRVQEFYVKHMPMIGDSHVCIFIVQLIRTNSWQERLPCLEWIICLFRLQNGWRGDTFPLTWSRRHAFIFVNVADPRSHEVMGPAVDTPAQKMWLLKMTASEPGVWMTLVKHPYLIQLVGNLVSPLPEPSNGTYEAFFSSFDVSNDSKGRNAVENEGRL